MSTNPSPSPVTILAGDPGWFRGREDPIAREVLASVGLPRARVAYLGAPNHDVGIAFAIVSKVLQKSGAGQVDFVRLAGRKPDLDSARAALNAADIVFISGGDVAHGMEVLGRSGILPALRARREAGVPFFGASAGGVMLTRRWLRWANPKDDNSATPFDCLGFAPLYCDVKGEGEDWAELRTLLRLLPVGTVGYGVVKGAGLRLKPDGTMAALGRPTHRLLREASGVRKIEDLEP